MPPRSSHRSGDDPRALKEGARTPPKIIADSDQPVAALASFIAQELEAWGFDLYYEGHAAIEVFLPAPLVIEIRSNGYPRDAACVCGIVNPGCPVHGVPTSGSDGG